MTTEVGPAASSHGPCFPALQTVRSSLFVVIVVIVQYIHSCSAAGQASSVWHAALSPLKSSLHAILLGLLAESPCPGVSGQPPAVLLGLVLIYTLWSFVCPRYSIVAPARKNAQGLAHLLLFVHARGHRPTPKGIALWAGHCVELRQP